MLILVDEGLVRATTTSTVPSPSLTTYVEGDWSNDEKLTTQAKKINNCTQYIYLGKVNINYT